MRRFATVLLAFWAGSLWTICGMVAPSLFALLDDRHLAGQIAAHFFRIETFVGVTIGAVLIAASLARKLVLPGRSLVWIAALLPLASTVVLGPLMAQARTAGDMARFGLLHAISAGCFLIACVATAVVVWKFSRPAE